MKIELDKAYMKRIKYFTLGFVIIYAIYVITENLNLVVQTTLGAVSHLFDILSPLTWGVVIAYLLLPLVHFFEYQLSHIHLVKKEKRIHPKEHKRLIRMISIFLSFTVLFLILFLMVYSIYVMIGGSFTNFSWEETWKYMQNYVRTYSMQIQNISTAMGDLGVSEEILGLIDGFSKDFALGIQELLAYFATRVGAIGRYLMDFSFGLVFAVNILYNREYFAKMIDNVLRLLFVEKRRLSIVGLFKEINSVLSSFIRGKILDLTLLSFVTALALGIIRFEFAFLVGVFAGYTNIVPYLGTWLGIIPAVIIAFINSGVERAIMVGLYIVIVQQVYIMLISPRVQGKSIGLHPFFVLLALIVFGAVFGLVGMVLSIPFAGILKVLIIRWARHRQKSKHIELHDLNNYR